LTFLQKLQLSEPIDQKNEILQQYNKVLTTNKFDELAVSSIATMPPILHKSLTLFGIKEGHINAFVTAAKEWKQQKGSYIVFDKSLISSDVSPFYSGLPKLGPRFCSSSDPAVNVEHMTAKLKVKENFQLLKNIPSRTFVSRIWTDLGNEQTLSWGSESDIQGYVKLVIRDVITAAGLEGEVSCMNELCIFRIRPDIWIVIKEGFPIGVLEVKKPDKKIMENERLHGQIFDYMIRLRNFYGQKHVFGIVSTYEEWRIYWLANDDCNDAAEASQIENSEISQACVVEDITTIPERFDFESESTDELITPSQEKRRLCGTPIIRYDDKILPHMLISVLLKMYHSPREEIPLVDPNRSYIQLNETNWYWVHYNKALNLSQVHTQSHKLILYQMPSTKAKGLVLLRDLRGGVHGRVWLACSTSGNVCVIKFSQDREASDLLKHEQTIWHDVWGLPARIQRFCDQGRRLHLFSILTRLFRCFGDAICETLF
jgi:hypothetical protein